jgi:hypothetical protein
MAASSEVSSRDLERYETILRRFENGEALSAYAGAIKELAKTYKTNHPSLGALSRIMAEVKYQEELANKMQTFASIEGRTESELFDEQATTVRDRLRQASKVDRLPIDTYTASFLNIEEATYLTQDLRETLAARIRQQYERQSTELVLNGYAEGATWENIAQRVKSLRARLEQIVTTDEADGIIGNLEKQVVLFVSNEQKIVTELSQALLLAIPNSLEELARLLRDIEVDGFESSRKALNANRIARFLEELMEASNAQFSRERREDSTKWARSLERLRGRSEGDGWGELLEAERSLLSRTTDKISVLRDSLARLLAACLDVDPRVRAENRNNDRFFGVPAVAFRRSWARLEKPIRRLEDGLIVLDATERRRLEFVPRNPPKVDAAVKTWTGWMSETKNRLAGLFELSGIVDFEGLADECLVATRRELDAWQTRQRTSAQVLKAIDSGAPWERVAETASKSGEPEVAEAIKTSMHALRGASSWRDLTAVCAGMAPTSLALAMYTLGKSERDVERLGGFVLDAIESDDQAMAWVTAWLDAFDEEAGLWSALVRFAVLAIGTLRAPAGHPFEELLELDFDRNRSENVLEGHRALRSLRSPDIDLRGLQGPNGSRARKLLTDLDRKRERAEVLLEVRMALYGALALVPTSDEHKGQVVRPQWTARDEASRVSHLTQEWVALFKSSDDFYWKTRALAPISRKVGNKVEFALLGLIESMHLSPSVLEYDGSASEEELPPTPTALLSSAVAIESAVHSVSSSEELIRRVREKLERQFNQVALGLLALDLERPSEYGIGRARWVRQRVSAGFGAAAASRPQMQKLRRMLDDAEWVLKRGRLLPDSHASLRAELIEAIDIGFGRAGLAFELPDVIDRLLALDLANASPLDIASLVTEALNLTGTQAASGQGSRILLDYVISSLQEYVRKQVQNLSAESRQQVLGSLRQALFESSDRSKLQQSIEQLAFVDAGNEPTHALRKYLFGP